MRKREPPRGTRLRGYHIHVQRERLASHWPYEPGDPTYWSPEGDIPLQWKAVRQDPTVLSARLIRSGKLFQTYQRSC
jgi:hypothetical protein